MSIKMWIRPIVLIGLYTIIEINPSINPSSMSKVDGPPRYRFGALHDHPLWPGAGWVEMWIFELIWYVDILLAGGWTNPSERYEFATWDDEIPNICEKKNMFRTTKQWWNVSKTWHLMWTSWNNAVEQQQSRAEKHDKQNGREKNIRFSGQIQLSKTCFGTMGISIKKKERVWNVTKWGRLNFEKCNLPFRVALKIIRMTYWNEVVELIMNHQEYVFSVSIPDMYPDDEIKKGMSKK